MIQIEKEAKQYKAIELLKQGLTQKEISKEIGVSQQTLTEWLKDFKAQTKAKEKRIELFEGHLTRLLESEKPNISDIERLTKTMIEYKKA